MENLRDIVLDQVRLGGACAVGVATTETLAGLEPPRRALYQNAG